MADSAPPAVLVIDTAGARCAAAILRGGAVLAERNAAMARGHAECLMPMVSDITAEAGLAAADLGAVVVCTGPGSFTGVRVGVAAARGVALGLGIEARGIDLFAALAFGHAGQVRIVLPGGAGQVFAQDFADGAPLGAPVPLAQAPASEGHVLRREVVPEVPLHVLAAAGLGEAATVPARPLYLRPPDALPSSVVPPDLIG